MKAETIANTRPTTQPSTPKAVLQDSAIELDCTIQPKKPSAKVIAKAKSSEHGEILEKLGAEVVYPERDMAMRLAHRLETAKMLDFIQLSERINISKIVLPSHSVGKTVVDLNLRSRFGLNIIAIENGGEIIENIRPDYVFKEKDILFLSGGKEGFIKLTEWTNHH